MARQGSERMPKAIDRVALDTSLYGVTKSLQHLGQDSKSVLDDMGDLMLEYLIDSGRIKHPERPEEFARALRTLLLRNGFGPKVPIRFKGQPPAPSVRGFIDYLKGSSGKPNHSERGSPRKGQVKT